MQVPRYKVPGFLLPRSTLSSSLPFLPYIFHLHLFFPMHQAQVFCTGAMLLCLNCSDDLPDMLLLLSWEGARVLSAEPQDSFLANILSVAGLFEYPGKSSTNCRLARLVPKKQFYQNFWQKKKCLVWQRLFRARCGKQRFKRLLCLSEVRSLARTSQSQCMPWAQAEETTTFIQGM